MRLAFAVPALFLFCACADDDTGGGGAGASSGTGGGGGTGTETSTATSTETFTGTDTATCGGTMLPDPCCEPFDLPVGDCPAEVPAPGDRCDQPNGICRYPENCGEFPDLVGINWYCDYDSLVWRRFDPGQPICPDGFSEIPIACPCTPPVAGETCGASVVSQISPCSYAACETYSCSNQVGGVWELLDCRE